MISARPARQAALRDRRAPVFGERLYTTGRARRALAGFELVLCESVTHDAEHRDGPRRVVDVVAIARTREGRTARRTRR